MGGLCSGGAQPENSTSIDEKQQTQYESHFKIVDNFWRMYNYEQTIAKGGSCDVLRVTAKKTSKVWAAKELHSYKHKVDKLFHREVEILRKLDDSHPNIVVLEGAYKDKNNFFIVTTYLSGGELFDRIVEQASKADFNEKFCANIIQMMLSALQHLHSFNIVHRDLKPENFVFETKHRNSNIRMIDFGSAIICEESPAKYREICGTPYYMPPEAVKNAERDVEELKRGDMFAIGVITYIMMSGRPPFAGKTDDEIFKKIIKGTYDLPQHVTWSTGLKAFVHRCLQTEPLARFAVDEALYDTWVTGTTASSDAFDLQVLGSLRKFVKESRLQKAIVGLMVRHVDGKDEENLSRMFKRLDKDGNGKISEHEMEVSLIDDGMYGPQAKLEAQKILKDCDENKDGSINFDEFVSARARNKLSTDLKVLHAVFQLLDENRDGSVDKNELCQIFTPKDESGNGGLGDADIVHMIEEVDTDKDGKISLEEFMGSLGQTGINHVANVIRKSVDGETRRDRRVSMNTEEN